MYFFIINLEMPKHATAETKIQMVTFNKAIIISVLILEIAPAIKHINKSGEEVKVHPKLLPIENLDS